MNGAASHGAPLDRPWWAVLGQPVALLGDDTVVLACNDALVDLLGVDRAAVEGRPLNDHVPGTHRGGIPEVLRLVADGVTWTGELVLRVAEAAVPARVRVASCSEGVLFLVEEVGTRDPASDGMDRRLSRLAAVAAELQSAADLDTLVRIVIDHIADAVGATTASLFVTVAEGRLAMLGVRGAAPDAVTRWATIAVDESTPVGSAALHGRPLLIMGRDELERRYPDITLAAAGERSILALPLVIEHKVIGVATLSYPGVRAMSQGELEFFRVMADSCAQALERIRTAGSLREQHDKLQFLAAAGVELGSSLDYQATLRNVAWLAVPTYATWCSISLEQDGVLRTLAVAHDDPAKIAVAEELQRRYPSTPDDDAVSYQVLRTGETVLLPEITDEMLVQGARDEEHLELLRQLSLRSVLTVALKARGRTFGVLTWVNDETGRRFGPDDIAFGEEVARRAAIAIDNALLHSEIRTIADRLQGAVRPPELPAAPGWQLTSSYISAGRVDVGGDFYDAIPLPDGRMVLVIGDVMGRGVEAAAAMAQIRAATRAFVAVDPDPVAVVSRLDVMFEQFPSDQLVTMLCVLVDPHTDLLRIVCAGHPAPLLLDGRGGSSFVDSAHGTLLGVGLTERHAAEVPLPPGHALLMFTDGLIERRGEDMDGSRRRLQETVVRLADKDHHLDLHRLTEEMRDPVRDDDIAVLCAQRLPVGHWSLVAG